MANCGSLTHPIKLRIFVCLVFLNRAISFLNALSKVGPGFPTFKTLIATSPATYQNESWTNSTILLTEISSLVYSSKWSTTYLGTKCDIPRPDFPVTNTLPLEMVRLRCQPAWRREVFTRTLAPRPREELIWNLLGRCWLRRSEIRRRARQVIDHHVWDRTRTGGGRTSWWRRTIHGQSHWRQGWIESGVGRIKGRGGRRRFVWFSIILNRNIITGRIIVRSSWKVMVSYIQVLSTYSESVENPNALKLFGEDWAERSQLWYLAEKLVFP